VAVRGRAQGNNISSLESDKRHYDARVLAILTRGEVKRSVSGRCENATCSIRKILIGTSFGIATILTDDWRLRADDLGPGQLSGLGLAQNECRFRDNASANTAEIYGEWRSVPTPLCRRQRYGSFQKIHPGQLVCGWPNYAGVV